MAANALRETSPVIDPSVIVRLVRGAFVILNRPAQILRDAISSLIGRQRGVAEIPPRAPRSSHRPGPHEGTRRTDSLHTNYPPRRTAACIPHIRRRLQKSGARNRSYRTHTHSRADTAVRPQTILAAPALALQAPDLGLERSDGLTHRSPFLSAVGVLLLKRGLPLLQRHQPPVQRQRRRTASLRLFEGIARLGKNVGPEFSAQCPERSDVFRANDDGPAFEKLRKVCECLARRGQRARYSAAFSRAASSWKKRNFSSRRVFLTRKTEPPATKWSYG